MMRRTGTVSIVILALLFPALIGAAAAAASAAAAPTNAVAAPEAPERSPVAQRTKELAEKQALLKAEYELRAEQLRSEVADLLLEKQRLDAELNLAQARFRKQNAANKARAEALALQAKTVESELKLDVSDLRAKKDKRAMELALREQRSKQSELDAKQEIARIRLAMEKKTVLQEQALQELKSRQEALAAENALAAEEHRAALAELGTENERLAMELAHARKLQEKQVQELTAETALLALKNNKAQLEQTRREQEHIAAMTALQHELNEVQTAITLRQERDAYRDRVDRDVPYPDRPFRDDVLTISDRRIPLNGVIMEGTADYVTERIHFFNNQSTTAPIFIVIDRNPGGSVMEGYRIIKAMEASKAPVHVVVKSFAASMAATIATAAEHSYAYPNAILLHHQPSGMSWGNLTQQDEQMVIFREWARRLHATVAAKMGMTMEEFYQMMYEKNSDGDWQEFADEAQKLHWVDHVVDEIREEGVVKRPKSDTPQPIWWFSTTNDTPPDPKDNYVLLPRLKPFDFYFMYNPSGHYRWTD